MKKVYLSKTAHPAITSYLTRLGYAIEVVSHEGITYHPVSTHPDIFMCRFGVWKNISIFPGNPENLTSVYPGNIIYNAVCTDKYFIHNFKYTDKELLASAKRWKSARSGSAGGFCSSEEYGSAEGFSPSGELEFVDVSQGYTRCCCLPVDDDSFITSDMGIAKALTAANADVLVIEKGHIKLDGFDYGFIGGCAGHIMTTSNRENKTEAIKPTILFNGDLSAHPDYNKIAAFINDRGKNVEFFADYPLTDIGSIIASW